MMLKTLYIDIGHCSECKGCIEIAPEIFRFNDQTGFMEVIQADMYDDESIAEAMKNCPENCIKWDNYHIGRSGCCLKDECQQVMKP